MHCFALLGFASLTSLCFALLCFACIAEGYAIFGDIEKAMELSLSRFPAAVRESWVDTFKKLVEVSATPSASSATAAGSKDPTACPW